MTRAASEISTPWWTSYRGLRPRRIEMVDGTEGSSMGTGWKRRSRAASFSMCLRYSSTTDRFQRQNGDRMMVLTGCGANKLQPTRKSWLDHVSCIHATFRFTQVQKSIWEVVSRTRCEQEKDHIRSSSMNTITVPSSASISFNSVLNFDSNWPRIPVPATIDARSRDKTRLLNSD